MQPLLSEEAKVWRKRHCLWLVMDRLKNLEHFKVGNIMLEPSKLILVDSSSELHKKGKTLLFRPPQLSLLQLYNTHGLF